jgi:hypothetical protein
LTEREEQQFARVLGRGEPEALDANSKLEQFPGLAIKLTVREVPIAIESKLYTAWLIHKYANNVLNQRDSR